MDGGSSVVVVVVVVVAVVVVGAAIVVTVVLSSTSFSNSTLMTECDSTGLGGFGAGALTAGGCLLSAAESPRYCRSLPLAGAARSANGSAVVPTDVGLWYGGGVSMGNGVRGMVGYR